MKDNEFYATKGYNAETTSIPNVGSKSDETFSMDGEEESSNLFGLGKRAHERKLQRIQGKADKRRAVGEAKKLEAEAKIAAAKATEKTGIATAKSLTHQAKAALQAEAIKAQSRLTPMEKVGIAGGAILVVGGGLLFFFLRKKK